MYSGGMRGEGGNSNEKSKKLDTVGKTSYRLRNFSKNQVHLDLQLLKLGLDIADFGLWVARKIRRKIRASL